MFVKLSVIAVFVPKSNPNFTHHLWFLVKATQPFDFERYHEGPTPIQIENTLTLLGIHQVLKPV